MIIPGSSLDRQYPWAQPEPDRVEFLYPQGMAPKADDDRSDIIKEWQNPKALIATVLMVVGGDTVRSALAQATGSWFAPVCFSFGWISYALSALVGIFGDGKLLPPPDYPVKVFNLTTGYSRNNRHWVIGRIVRDHPTLFSRQKPLANNGIRIAIYKAKSRQTVPGSTHRLRKLHIYCILVMAIQMFIASIPAILTNGREWGVFCITAVGTFLAFITGTLPQWRAEKLPNHQESHQIYGLTTGNGSRDIMIIKGAGRCLNLEELAMAESPENGRPWTKFTLLSKRQYEDSAIRISKEIFQIPLGFFISRLALVLLAICWILLFITLPALDDHTWYLLAVGSIGTFWNAVISGMKIDPENRNLPLKLIDSIATWKVMDGLMDLEVRHAKCGQYLLSEFFPGPIRKEEEDWWNASPERRIYTEYDQTRLGEKKKRGTPRSAFPNYEQQGYVEGFRRQPESSNRERASETEGAITVPSITLGEPTPPDAWIPQQPSLAAANYGLSRTPSVITSRLVGYDSTGQSRTSSAAASIQSGETSRIQPRIEIAPLDGILTSTQSSNDQTSQSDSIDGDNLDEITKPADWE